MSQKQRMGKILIVDDEPELVDLVSFHFWSIGYETVGAQSGKEALKAVDESSFDCIVVDFRMDEMNGLQLLKTLREDGNTTPVVFITGFASVTLKEVLEAGGQGIVSKPIDYDRLEELVRGNLKKTG